MSLSSPASGSGGGWHLVLQMARTWCEGCGSHPDRILCVIAQVGKEMVGGRWVLKFIACPLEAKGGNSSRRKCLIECFSLADGLENFHEDSGAFWNTGSHLDSRI